VVAGTIPCALNRESFTNVNPNKDNIAVSSSVVNKTIVIAKDDMWLRLERTIR
jgi:hypothetical protein